MSATAGGGHRRLRPVDGRAPAGDHGRRTPVDPGGITPGVAQPPGVMWLCPCPTPRFCNTRRRMRPAPSPRRVPGRYALGIDFGTLSGRALLVDVDTGEEVATA